MTQKEIIICKVAYILAVLSTSAVKIGISFGLIYATVFWWEDFLFRIFDSNKLASGIILFGSVIIMINIFYILRLPYDWYKLGKIIKEDGI